MTPQRNRIGSRLNSEPTAVAKRATRQFPIQRTIQTLEEGLRAVNDRIAELEREHHHGHAMEVLKENALDLARQIDELRSVLVEQVKKAKA
jgi:predicted  nucleic acid-binding Zn-ribbon protein